MFMHLFDTQTIECATLEILFPYSNVKDQHRVRLEAESPAQCILSNTSAQLYTGGFFTVSTVVRLFVDNLYPQKSALMGPFLWIQVTRAHYPTLLMESINETYTPRLHFTGTGAVQKSLILGLN